MRECWREDDASPFEISAAYRRFLARPRSLIEISKPFTFGALGMLAGFVLMLVVGYDRSNDMPIVAEALVLPAEPAVRVPFPDLPSIPAPPKAKLPAVAPPRRAPRALVKKPATTVGRKSERSPDDSARWVAVGRGNVEQPLIQGLEKQPKLIFRD